MHSHNLNLRQSGGSHVARDPHPPAPKVQQAVDRAIRKAERDAKKITAKPPSTR
jgi:hypothetical protein